MKYSSKNKVRTAIFTSSIYIVILYFFYSIGYLEFSTIRAMYLTILGLSMVAILLDYYIFGQVFLIASIIGLVAEYNIYTNQTSSMSTASFPINNIILILGCIVGFMMQIYFKSIKHKK